MHGKRVQIEFILIGTGSRLWLLIENSLLYTLSSPVLHFIWWTLYYWRREQTVWLMVP